MMTWMKTCRTQLHRSLESDFAAATQLLESERYDDFFTNYTTTDTRLLGNAVLNDPPSRTLSNSGTGARLAAFFDAIVQGPVYRFDVRNEGHAVAFFGNSGMEYYIPGLDRKLNNTSIIFIRQKGDHWRLWVRLNARRVVLNFCHFPFEFLFYFVLRPHRTPKTHS